MSRVQERVSSNIDLRQGDEVSFDVVRHEATGKYHAAVYINNKLMVVGPARDVYDEASEDLHEEIEHFDDNVDSVQIASAVLH